MAGPINSRVAFGDKVAFKQNEALTTGTGEATRRVPRAGRGARARHLHDPYDTRQAGGGYLAYLPYHKAWRASPSRGDACMPLNAAIEEPTRPDKSGRFVSAPLDLS